jgi:hypothetical protein
METVASVVWITAIGVYLLIAGLFFFLWYNFNEMRKGYWQNRHVEVKDPLRPIDLTPRSKNGIRVKPKYNSDEKLFEFEQNPAKR